MVDPAEIIEIHDPEIDVDALMAKIRTNLASRGETGPGGVGELSFPALRPDLYDAFLQLQQQVASYGNIGTARTGLAGRLDLLVKRVLRKAISRHLKQQQEVHQSMVAFLNLLLGEVEGLARNLSQGPDRRENKAGEPDDGREQE